MKISTDKTNKYLYFCDKNHPCANAGGKVYLHRHVWWEHTGDVPTGYHIHHIDGDKTNNCISNLEKLTPSQHTAIHQGELREKRLRSLKNKRKSDTERKSKIKDKKRGDPVMYEFLCQQCGRSITTKNKKQRFCTSKCYEISRRVVERPSTQEIISMVEDMGYVQTGKYFGVSDNAIRKWLKVAKVYPLPSKVKNEQ